MDKKRRPNRSRTTRRNMRGRPGNGITPEMAEAEGRERIDTPVGFAVYLSLVASYGNNPNEAGKTHAHAYLALGNEFATGSWDCSQDLRNYLCLLGEWYAADRIDPVRGDRTKRFAEMIEIPFVASEPWSARRIADEAAHREMEQFEVADDAQAETDMQRFIHECLNFMAHLMTGTLQAPDVLRLLNAWERCPVKLDSAMHELLRIESVRLAREFSAASLGERTKPLYAVLNTTLDFTQNKPVTLSGPAARPRKDMTRTPHFLR